MKKIILMLMLFVSVSAFAQPQLFTYHKVFADGDTLILQLNGVYKDIYIIGHSLDNNECSFIVGSSVADSNFFAVPAFIDLSADMSTGLTYSSTGQFISANSDSYKTVNLLDKAVIWLRIIVDSSVPEGSAELWIKATR